MSGGAQGGNAPRATPVSDTVSLIFSDHVWSGWTAVRIGRGIERFPSDFEVGLTERYPGEAGVLLVEPGSACVLKIGADLVITGAIDRYTPAISARRHEVRIHGRSLCRALTDCSAGVLPDLTMQTQIAANSVLGVTQQLAAPFGITVSSDAFAAGFVVPPIIINLGETVSEIFDRVTRWAGLLYYDTPDGNVVLAQVSASTMASGFQQGVNIESASATLSADARFSDYLAVWMSVDGLQQVRAASDGSTNGNSSFKLHDASLPPLGFRPHIIVSEQVNNAMNFAQIRATWEMNRRNGRSRAVTLTTDSWRDSAGTLWTPNALVAVDCPILKISNEQMLIGEVTYRKDESGTHADLTLMPPGAYAPEPYNLQPVNRQVAGALAGGAQKDRGVSAGTGFESSATGRGDL